MVVKYKNAKSEYFVLDEVGNFYYGGKQLTLTEFSYLKKKNGMVYPTTKGGQIYYSELLTPHIISLKNGLKYQTKQLQELYDLLGYTGYEARDRAYFGG